MERGPSQIATKSLTVLFESGTTVGLSDHELVERFADRRDEQDPAAEATFAALVTKHSPMVFQVCRTVLGDRHEAEDAFQAMFLVLASRAKSIRSRDAVGAWLYGVALRVASRARTQAMRRKRREQKHAARAETQAEGADMRPGLDGDIARILQEEIGRLPEKFREAVVLCYLEGLTHEMAAGELGCPVGTIRSRLATARERLKRRLTRRGIAAAAPLEWLASSSIRLAESVSAGTAVPVALVEGAIRGAMQIGLGREALAGRVSARAVTLMEGTLSNMMTTKLMIMAVPVLVAGFVTAGVGLASNSAPRREEDTATAPAISQEVPQKKGSSTPPSSGPQPKPSSKAPSNGELKKAFRRQDEVDVQRLIREYQEKEDAFLKTMQEAKTTEAQAALQTDRVNPAFYAGALLQLAEQDPGTPAAEEALIWIATHLLYGSMVERAKEMIVRDHIKGDKLEPLFNIRQIQMVGSTATERLFREALEKNQDRKIRGMACYHLACFLDTRAASIRVRRLFDPERLKTLGAAITKEGWGYDYEERLNKLDVEALEREAESLYGRVITEFADIPLEIRSPLYPREATYAEAARRQLSALRDLGIGRPAPEIEGLDLDGKPMKLSDYRGKVVAIYFCGPVQLSADGTGKPAMVTAAVRDEALRHANEAFALLGVAVPSPGRASDRESFGKLLGASGLPARFWWDQEPDGKPGPIQTAWNARVDLILIDPQGRIRYKHILQPELLKKTVAELLKEAKSRDAGPGKKD